jgi:asparaginyl-tRNA synthetase
MKITNKQLKKDYQKLEGKKVSISGWVRSNRDQKEFGFLVINDGSTFDVIQIVYFNTLKSIDLARNLRAGACISVTGNVVVTPNNAQAYEIHASDIELLGDASEDYPIQPKRHTREFLREQAYLRPRTNLFNAVFRVRSKIAFAIHKFFQDQNYIYVHTPLITANDAEGAGSTFSVSTFDFNNIPRSEDGSINYSKDFFGKPASLAVTGQLEGEAFALSFGNIYTFGPTFRAENSNTLTHASEFWMIEPEMAFVNLQGNMDIMEKMVKYLIKYMLKELSDEVVFFDKFVSPGLKEKLQKVEKSKFARVSHHDCIKILLDAMSSGVKFENKPEFGCDIAKEHERYLTDVAFKSPVFVTDWPKDIKAFYMKLNPDKETVAAVDLLVPGAGELCGGSQREENYDLLVKRMQDMKIPSEGLQWYLNLRRYGGCVHSGFGMGFERLLIYLTGVENIRDVLPFPRTPKSIEF